MDPCSHLCPNPGGVCSLCGKTTCHLGIAGCFCQVDWPYELQCPECRDAPRRFDRGYCVCVPVRMPPRPPSVPGLAEASSRTL